MRRHRSPDPNIEITAAQPDDGEQRQSYALVKKAIDREEDTTLLIATASVAGLMLATYIVRRRLRGGDNT